MAGSHMDDVCMPNFSLVSNVSKEQGLDTLQWFFDEVKVRIANGLTVNF